MQNGNGLAWSRGGVMGCFVGAWLVAAAGVAGAQPVVLQVDEGASFIEVTLDVGGFADTDSAAVGGTITVDPPTPSFPNDLLVYGYDLALLEPLNLSLGGGFIGTLAVNFLDLTVVDDFGGEPLLATVVNDGFTLPDAPSVLGGTLNYNATGLFCVTLGGSNLPCQDSQNLSDQGTIFLTFSGEVQVVGTTVTLIAAIDAVAPLDPANPGLGTISVAGLIVGTGELATVPSCAGDLNGDGIVDALDLSVLLSAFGSGDAGDINGDGLTDASDLSVLLNAFGSVCD